MPVCFQGGGFNAFAKKEMGKPPQTEKGIFNEKKRLAGRRGKFSRPKEIKPVQTKRKKKDLTKKRGNLNRFTEKRKIQEPGTRGKGLLGGDRKRVLCGKRGCGSGKKHWGGVFGNLDDSEGTRKTGIRSRENWRVFGGCPKM